MFSETAAAPQAAGRSQVATWEMADYRPPATRCPPPEAPTEADLGGFFNRGSCEGRSVCTGRHSGSIQRSTSATGSNRAPSPSRELKKNPNHLKSVSDFRQA